MGDLPHERYIGFATNFEADVTGYHRDWGQGTGWSGAS